ncbi:ribosome biogenesis regulatory protein-domain-containing protein [Crepidotus variabilis]|uniref:Ribosome biogenesis regulatory protein n=1 Tax=Crepidotus variabilis TaxID=179855 RepID=A0A9P6JW45_9AGAR|nr:ribosome biogenesis regulatory protein-domain-containing protein [Crepidotus variabilis]
MRRVDCTGLCLDERMWFVQAKQLVPRFKVFFKHHNLSKMDVSAILASQIEKYQSVTVEKETPLEVDNGLLLVTDLNPVDEESYNENLEDHLQNLAREGVQTLLTSLFSLPTKPSPDGPLAILPPRIYQLPRAKPLPKPKPPTKWERFASAKGIQKKGSEKRDKKVWDEEKQDWVSRWGWGGKNREKEIQWLHVVPANADAEFDPRKAARDERKERIAKNDKRQQQNIARASGSTSAPQQRKSEIDTTLATTRISTASMGKFDRKLDGEKKMRGIKRKFEPTETRVDDEAKSSLALLSKMESDGKKIRMSSKTHSTEGAGGEGTLNVRKAIRFESKGRGGVALSRGGSSSRGRGGKKPMRGRR